MLTRSDHRRQFRATILLATITALAMAAFLAATDASAQSGAMIVLQPDQVTGVFTAKATSNTNDARLDRVCLFRIDSNALDPAVPVVCNDASSGRQPTAEEGSNGGVGLIYELSFSTVLVPGEDQLFTARNIARIGGDDTNPVEISSVNADNSAFIPAGIDAPMFIIPSP